MNTREIDELLGTPGRLAIMATLAQVDSLAFTDLGRETGLADGNLHVQTRKLLQGGYISGSKERKGNRQVTCFSLTEMGRNKIRAHARLLAEASGLSNWTGAAGPNRRRGGRIKDDSQVW